MGLTLDDVVTFGILWPLDRFKTYRVRPVISTPVHILVKANSCNGGKILFQLS